MIVRNAARMAPPRPIAPAAREPLEQLDGDAVLDGYIDALRNVPEPASQTRSYWHGWRAGLNDVPLLRVNARLRAFIRDARRPRPL